MLQHAYKMIHAFKHIMTRFCHSYLKMFIVGSFFAMTSLYASAQNRSFDFTTGDTVTLTNAGSALSNRTTFTLEFWAKFTNVSGTINLVDFTGGADAGGLILNSGILTVDLEQDFRDWAEAMNLPLKPLAGLRLQETDAPVFVRHTCCLHFRRDDGKLCANCPRLRTKNTNKKQLISH